MQLTRKNLKVYELSVIRYSDFHILLSEIAKYCDSFSLESDKEFNGFLPQSLITNLINEITYDTTNGGMVCKRYYKLNSETLNFLSQMKDIYDYPALKIIRPVKGDYPEIGLRMSQENLDFYHDGKCVLRTLSHEGYCTIYDKTICNIIYHHLKIVKNKIRDFITSLYEKIQSLEENEAVRYFSLSEYDSRFFMFNLEKYYPQRFYYLIDGLFEFISRDEVIRQCALVICDRVKKNNYFGIDDLYIWLSNGNSNHSADLIIENFLLSCDERVFINSYNNLLKNIIVNIAFTYDCLWVDKLVSLWYKRGLNSDKLDKEMSWFLKEYSDVSNGISQYLKKHIICLKCATLLSDSFKKSIVKYLDNDNENDRVSVKIFKAYKYFYGVGVHVNYNKAFEGFIIGARNQAEDCQYDLARCYLNGWGTEKDIEQAKYWFGKAAENGHPKARKQLERLSNACTE